MMTMMSLKTMMTMRMTTRMRMTGCRRMKRPSIATSRRMGQPGVALQETLRGRLNKTKKRRKMTMVASGSSITTRMRRVPMTTATMRMMSLMKHSTLT